MLSKIPNYVNQVREERTSIKEQSVYSIQFYNCWKQRNEDMYWRQYIESHHLLDSYPEKKVAVFSVFGRRKMIEKVNADVKIFFSGENLKRQEFLKYADYGLTSDIDLAIGFEAFDHPKYQRFPLWMDYMFDPWLTEEDIRNKCQRLRYPSVDKKNRFCCMVASNPGDGLRKEMMDAISLIEKVDSAGRYLHNDDSLKHEYGDVKVDYLSSYQFNICPENTNAYGYVTEKLFESISCGCIPIYWGSDLRPEPDVLNKDALILWDRKDKGQKALMHIRELHESPALLKDFLAQPRLLPTAEEYVLDTFSAIESKLRMIIEKP